MCVRALKRLWAWQASGNEIKKREVEMERKEVGFYLSLGWYNSKRERQNYLVTL